MPDLREIITRVRKEKYEGTDKSSAFISGDVAPGSIRDVKIEKKAEQDPDATAQHREDDDAI